MKEQIKNEDYKQIAEASSEAIDYHSKITEPSLKASLKALIYKNALIQSRHWCSNICQIITPIVCLLFTLFVRVIVQGITTGAIMVYKDPQPFNVPAYNYFLRQRLNLSCNQMHYYQADQSSQLIAEELIDLQLQDYCPSEKRFNALFVRKNQTRPALMERLKEADTTAFERGDDLKTQIPDGIINFRQSNTTHLSATFSINDFRLAQYHKNNGATKILIKTKTAGVIGTYLRVTEGMMTLLDKITRPFLQISNQSEVIAGSYIYMPFSGEDTSLIDKAVNVIGSGLYPLGLALLMPIFLYTVVSEKEEKQIEIMKMNGLDSKHYWVSFFIMSFLLSMLTSLTMYLFGVFVFQIQFFTDTSPLLIWAVFVGWAIAQIAMTSLVQIFINNSKTATIVGYIISIFSTLIGEVIATLIFPLPMTFPYALLLYPPFALCRIIYYLGWSCSNNTGCYRSLAGLEAEPIAALVVLFCWSGVFVLSIWLNQMVQQEYGVAKRPKAIERCVKCCKKPKRYSQLQEEIESGAGTNKAGNQIEMSAVQAGVDDSVHKHRQEVNELNPLSASEALIIKDICKKYDSDNGETNKIALKPFTLHIVKGEIFGFLGPNGAGKTTLISVLTGMYPPTAGNAYISGRQIGLPATNQLIGVCPQFDILWRELSVQEHLRFYCKLKQVSQEQIQGRVSQLLAEVDLTAEKHFKVRQLSGGMQRRVSIACALAGSPRVVILDEPTSGLDPYHRREIWKILQKCKKKTSIFMTSHLMDEVEFLCDRIGIISQGELRCLGDLRTLKQKFGKGYRLTLSYPLLVRNQSGMPALVECIIKKMGLQVVSELETRVVVKIEKKDMREAIELLKKEERLDWSINQPSLYDVFMHFVK